MKNSLFKRVAAAAAAVPLALTQCLTVSSFAVTNNDSIKLAENVVKAESDDSKVITLQSILEIPGDELVSTWNLTLDNALKDMIADGAVTGTIDHDKLVELVDSIDGKAGDYEEIIKKALNLAIKNDVTYEVTTDRNIVIKGTVEQPTFEHVWEDSPLQMLKELAEKYNAPEIEDIDLSSVALGGEFTATLYTHDLAGGTLVPGSFEYVIGKDSYALGQLPQLALDKLAEIKAVAYAGIDKALPAEYAEQAKADFDSRVEKYEKQLNRINNGFEDAIAYNATFNTENTYENTVGGLLQSFNYYLEHHTNVKKRVPESGAAVFGKKSVANAWDIVCDIINENSKTYSIDITAEELGAFADSLYDVTFNTQDGVATFTASFEDAEIEDVREYVESLGYTLVSSYKEITAVADYSAIKTVEAGYVDVQIERVTVTETTTTTTSTTTTSTTSTTTDETTTSTENTTTTTTTTVTGEPETSTTTTTTVTGEPETSTTTTTTVTGEPETSTTTTTTVTGEPETSTTTSTTVTGEPETSTTTTTTVTGEPETSTTTTTVTGEPETSTTTTTVTSGPEETSTTTTSVTTAAPVTSTYVQTQYVTYDSMVDESFYLNIEDEFDVNLISNPVLHVVLGEGYVDENDEIVNSRTFEETFDLAGKFGFGGKTPGNTYEDGNNNGTFAYEITLTYEGDDLVIAGQTILTAGDVLKTGEGEDLTATVYIGVKGDTDLNGVADAMDASATLTYYAKLSAGFTAENTILSPSKLVTGTNSVYENFAAFLSDVKPDDSTRFFTKNVRGIDAMDASAILTYYARRSSSEQYGEYTDKQIWDEMDNYN